MTSLLSGDGANDVSMIQAADIGIGISGQEGMQVPFPPPVLISSLLSVLLVGELRRSAVWGKLLPESFAESSESQASMSKPPSPAPYYQVLRNPEKIKAAQPFTGSWQCLCPKAQWYPAIQGSVPGTRMFLKSTCLHALAPRNAQAGVSSRESFNIALANPEAES